MSYKSWIIQVSSILRLTFLGFFEDLIYLVLERGVGREKVREG